MTEPIRVALVDDQLLFASGLAMVIDSQPDLAVAWRAQDGQEALDRAAEDPPELVLMDVQMPVLNGIDATRTLVAEHPSTRVVILTTFDSEQYVVDGLGAGASGFLLKDTPPEELLAALRTVHAGDAVISPRSTKRLVERLRPSLGQAPPVPLARDDRRIVESLTPRELEILEAIAKGWSNTEICEQLFVSMPTVKTHVSHVLAKTGSRDRVQAVLFAFRAGLVSQQDLLQHPHTPG